MDTTLNSNVNIYEVVGRILAGIVLLASVIFNTVVPVWFALLAIYPVMTAIIAWDPIYAVVLKVISFFESHHFGHKGPMAV